MAGRAGLALGGALASDIVVKMLRELDGDMFGGSMLRSIMSWVPDTPPRALGNAPDMQVDIDTIRTGLETSLISLCPAARVRNATCVCRTKYSHVAAVQGHSRDALALVAVAKRSRQIVVAYRMPMSMKEWILAADFALLQLPHAPPGVRVNHLLFNYFETIQSEVLAAARLLLERAEHSRFTIRLTGYGLGGALATLAVPSWLDFLARTGHPSRIECYAYASPRVGNAAFAQFLAYTPAIVVRYTNNNDVVPHLPPRSFNYTHAGFEYHLRGTRLVACSPNYDEDPACALRQINHVSFSRHFFVAGHPLKPPPLC